MLNERTISDARAALSDLCHVPDGGEGHKKKDEKLQAQKLARQYLSGGWKILKELGAPMIGAVLAALPRTEINIDEIGALLLSKNSLQWEDILPHLQLGPQMKKIIKEIAKKDRRLFLQALGLANAIADLKNPGEKTLKGVTYV